MHGGRHATTGSTGLHLADGAKVGVIGGGPAGSFYSYFLLEMARRAGLQLDVDIYEPRDFSSAGPTSCNMCGGIVSESLLQNLVAEGIRIPSAVVQKRIDSYFLHMDVGNVRIETPLGERRIAAVYRGGGPRGQSTEGLRSFDGHLLELATERGARAVRERVGQVTWTDGRPRITTDRGSEATFDLVVVATGVNSSSWKLFEGCGLGYRPPRVTKTHICEFRLGRSMVEQYLGSSMHVFLLDIPRLEFAAIIPKGDYVTVCLLGENIDRTLIEAFLYSPEVRECMPPHWKPPGDFCRCSPRINVGAAVQPFADRIVFVGDCGVSRLYKDGIGAAYRTAKAAAKTSVFEGLSAEDFRRHYWPVCQALRSDNRLGAFVFRATRLIQRTRPARQALWRVVSDEQHVAGARRRMSLVLWDTFTGSAPYRSILRRFLDPMLTGRFLWAAGGLRARAGWRKREVRMATGASGLLGKKYRDSEVIYHQGEKGDCMYVILGGEVEVIQRKGDKEFCLATLGDGDFFGEMGLFEEDLRSSTVRARGEVWVYTLERRNLLRRLHEDPSLAYRIIEKMSHRIRNLENALVRKADVPF